jgi:hypothetical protein
VTAITYKPMYTLQIIVGLLGGLSSAIFGVLPWIVGWYNDYRVKSEVIENLYKDAEDNDNPIDLKQKIVSSKPFRFSFKDYYITKVSVICCCFRDEARSRKLDKYERAKKRMDEEFDILKIIKEVRVLNMLTSALFSYEQAIFVDYADRFLIKSQDDRPTYHSIDDLRQIVEDFNPNDSRTDLKLANYLAGKVLYSSEIKEYSR